MPTLASNTGQRFAGARRDSLTRALARPAPLALALALAVAAPGSAGADPDALHGGILRPVENCNDAGAGSLRAIAAQAVDGDGIDLGALACSRISLTSGAITLRDVALIGPGAAALTIDGAGNQGHRIFNHVGHGGGLTISDVTVQGAKYQSDAGQGGGCLRSDAGPLRIRDSVFDGCIAFAPVGSAVPVRGGAIAAYGSYVSLSGVTLARNQARAANGVALGGALYASGTDLAITRSTVADNSVTAIEPSAFPRGGGVFTRGSAVIIESTLDGNLSEGPGGGASIEAGGMLVRSTVSNNSAVGGTSGVAFLGLHGASAGVYSSTIAGNASEASVQWGGGALYVNTAGAIVANSTVAGNTESNADSLQWGAGIVFGPTASGATLVSTIAFDNEFHNEEHTFLGLDVVGADGLVIGGSHNQVGGSFLALPADTERSNPQLGPLQDNGGPTRTRMPAPDSTAIDRGIDNGEATDQRGYARVIGVAADVGAVETRPDWIFIDGFDPPCIRSCP